jgi:hypothetical protein
LRKCAVKIEVEAWIANAEAIEIAVKPIIPAANLPLNLSERGFD